MTHKLLVADESVTIQRVVELTFSGEDVQVITVGDGDQAIARIPVERPDIVLADIGMPKRSGYDVAAFVKGRPDLSHIPVLLLAGAFEPVDEARADHVQSDGVLVKPFEPQQVISRVKMLIAASRAGLAADRRRSTIVQEQKAAVPESTDGSTESRLDDDFSRLDAVFAKFGSEMNRPPVLRSSADDPHDADDIPTLESLLAVSSGAHDEKSPSTAQPAPAEELPGYRAVLPRPTASQPPEDMSQASRKESPVAVTDGLVEEVTRRVAERLATGAANALVAQIVSEVAERLIREEISRIKAAAAARL